MYHIGLGDMIICNGMVRELAKQYEKIYLPCYVSNGPSVSFMFSDLPNVIIQEIYGPNEIFTLQMHHEAQGNKVLKLGIYLGEPHLDPETFDQMFYRQAGVEFSKRWDGFKIPPQILDVPIFEKTIAFICDSDERGFRIDDSKINPEIIKVRPWHSSTIFDFIPYISKASEIHCIDTSWLHLVESIPTKVKLFYHLYVRNNGLYHQSKKRKNWTILS